MSSYSHHDDTTTRGKLIGRQRPMHVVLGGGKVADVLLWKNINVTAAIAIGVTLVWFLFEVVEYNFVTLFCHISITTMLLVFIWCTAAQFFNWDLPKIPPSIFDEKAFHEVASDFHQRFNFFLSKLLDIANGRDPALFILTIAALYVLSVIGDNFSLLNFLYWVFICLITLPFLCDRYEEEVDDFAVSLIQQANNMYKRIDSRVLSKIPRGPVKEKKG